ncbi:MAG: site-specific integrase [Clostridia bacterium]|nr:site-specific integrase [Clostridia bacterium]
MSEKKLLTNGNVFKRTDGRWGGVVWYMDETGERRRKSFSGTTKAEVNKKMTEYIAKFEEDLKSSNESNQTLKESMQTWLEVFKYPSVERTTYDRLECTAKHHIYTEIGDKVVSSIKAVDIKKILNSRMQQGYAYTTIKKIHSLLNEYFRYLTEQEIIDKNPMRSAPMIKRHNFMSAQGKENLPTNETVTVFTDEEIEKLEEECFKTWGTGKRLYQQSAAYILMLNTGIRTGEMLGLLNSDIDLDNRVMHIQRGVKEIYKRDGTTAETGREISIGKLKSASSKRDVPLNNIAIEMIKELRNEYYFGENTPLVCDENGNYTRPVNFRKRFYRILKGANIETKGLHALRHTFATKLVNGIKQPDGSIKSLTPRQVADLLGHSTSEITERYYVKKDTTYLNGITDEFEM